MRETIGKAWALHGLHDQAQIGAAVLGLAAQQPLNGDDRIADELQHFTGRSEETGRFGRPNEVRNDTRPSAWRASFFSGTAEANSNSLFAPWGSPSLFRLIFCREQKLPRFIRKVNRPVSQIGQLPGLEDQVANPRPVLEPLLNLYRPPAVPRPASSARKESPSACLLKAAPCSFHHGPSFGFLHSRLRRGQPRRLSRHPGIVGLPVPVLAEAWRKTCPWPDLPLRLTPAGVQGGQTISISSARGSAAGLF